MRVDGSSLSRSTPHGLDTRKSFAAFSLDATRFARVSALS